MLHFFYLPNIFIVKHFNVAPIKIRGFSLFLVLNTLLILLSDNIIQSTLKLIHYVSAKQCSGTNSRYRITKPH